ncbi:MAG: hypothetical protein P8X89_10630, partial [Reinekea sp.]
ASNKSSNWQHSTKRKNSGADLSKEEQALYEAYESDLLESSILEMANMGTHLKPPPGFTKEEI